MGVSGGCGYYIGVAGCRLSESNMKSISAQVEQLYRENSRNGTRL